MTTPTAPRLADPSFWHQSLAERMAEFAQIRETGPFATGDPQFIGDREPLGALLEAASSSRP